MSWLFGMNRQQPVIPPDFSAQSGPSENGQGSFLICSLQYVVYSFIYINFKAAEVVIRVKRRKMRRLDVAWRTRSTHLP